jgi:hypothetical protein
LLQNASVLKPEQSFFLTGSTDPSLHRCKPGYEARYAAGLKQLPILESLTARKDSLFGDVRRSGCPSVPTSPRFPEEVSHVCAPSSPERETSPLYPHGTSIDQIDSMQYYGHQIGVEYANLSS